MNPETTILLVDDEENILRALKRVLMDQDIRILTTTSPFEAIEMLKTNNVSVIVSDNLMPGSLWERVKETAGRIAALKPQSA